MAISNEVTSIAIRLKLNNGNDSSGNPLYVYQSMPALDTEGYDDSKMYAVAQGLNGIFDLTRSKILKTTKADVINQ